MTHADVLDDLDDAVLRSHPATQRRWRPVLVSLLAVVGCIGLVVSLVAVAAARTVLRTDRFAATVERSLDDPAVTDAIAAVLADQVVVAVAESGALARVVPDDLQRLVPVLERALRGFVFEEAATLLASERGRTLVVDVVRLAHEAALRIVDGKEPDRRGLVVVGDGRVGLNLVPLVSAILRAAERAGLVEVDGPIPELDVTLPVGEQIERLGASLGRDLPPTFGQLTVYERRGAGDMSHVGVAQRLLELLRSTVALLVLASLLLLVAALVFSTDRLRTATWVAGGLAVGGLLALLLVRRVAGAVPDLVDDPGARDAVTSLSAAALAGVFAALAWLTVIAVVGGGTLLAARSTDARAVPARFPAVTRVVAAAIAATVLVWLGVNAATIAVAAVVVTAGVVLPVRRVA